MKIKTGICILLLVNLIISSAEADIFIEKQQFSDIAMLEVTGTHADELFEALLDIPEKVNFKCIKYSPSRTNSAGDCEEFSNEVESIEKSVRWFYCKKTPLNEANCQFRTRDYNSTINGDRVLLSDGYGNNISNDFAVHLKHLPEQTFKSSDGALSIMCETLVQNRYFDCFVQIQ